MTTQLPTLTADLPGCGGTFKATPEDFEVEEIPAYEPSGEQDCEHLYLWIEKRGRSTQDVAKALARHCGMNEKDVSWAGLKDRQAVTRQYLCAPARYVEPKLATFVMDGVTVLKTARHRNKLKGGHLRGNRFSLVVRGVTDQAWRRRGWSAWCAWAFPTTSGSSASAWAATTRPRGKRILQSGGRHRDRFERKLFLSAYQSDLFNRVLAQPAGGGHLRHRAAGRRAQEEPHRRRVRLRRPARSINRASTAFEVSPTGPLFGPEMRRPEGVVDALEERGARPKKASPASSSWPAATRRMGARRLLRVPLSLESADGEGEVLRLTLLAARGQLRHGAAARAAQERRGYSSSFWLRKSAAWWAR